MLIALLALLGVDLVVIVVLLMGVLGRRRWVKRQSDAFPGAIRVSAGEVDGLGGKWKRGYGRWVRDLLVWTKAPLLLRNVLLPVDGMKGERRADSGVVAEFACEGGAVVEIEIRDEHSKLARGRWVQSA
jgi:hypothetical protein